MHDLQELKRKLDLLNSTQADETFVPLAVEPQATEYRIERGGPVTTEVALVHINGDSVGEREPTQPVEALPMSGASIAINQAALSPPDEHDDDVHELTQEDVVDDAIENAYVSDMPVSPPDIPGSPVTRENSPVTRERAGTNIRVGFAGVVSDLVVSCLRRQKSPKVSPLEHGVVYNPDQRGASGSTDDIAASAPVKKSFVRYGLFGGLVLVCGAGVVTKIFSDRAKVVKPVVLTVSSASFSTVSSTARPVQQSVSSSKAAVLPIAPERQLSPSVAPDSTTKPGPPSPTAETHAARELKAAQQLQPPALPQQGGAKQAPVSSPGLITTPAPVPASAPSNNTGLAANQTHPGFSKGGSAPETPKRKPIRKRIEAAIPENVKKRVNRDKVKEVRYYPVDDPKESILPSLPAVQPAVPEIVFRGQE